jgi:Domain of unknown function (DUF4185)
MGNLVRTALGLAGIGAALASTAAPATAGVRTAATALNAEFAAMNGPGWTGGDASWSVRLADGRTVWLFGDSFLGGVRSDGSRDPDSQMVRNSMIVQGGDGRMRTVTPHTAVPASHTDDWYWPGPPVTGAHGLQVPYAHIVRTGPGSWDFKADGTCLAEFSAGNLRLRRLTPIATPPGVNMASAAASDHRFTYIYGTRPSADGLGRKDAFVARAPRGRLERRWHYWTGARWSSTPARAVAVAAGVSDQFSVVRSDGGWVLITQSPLSNQIVAFRARSPQGRWERTGVVATIPPIAHAITYNATVHPEFSHGRELVVGYNVNGADMGAVFADASLYRPRFMTVVLPKPNGRPR